MSQQKTDARFIRDLGDGLILRHATREDTEALVDFNSRMHSDPSDSTFGRGVGIWTRDLLTRPHPTFQPSDFTIVEEVATGKIVSSLNFISQIWRYADIPFKVGRPELVATDPEYRRRGLVRTQMELIHEWSAERGELVQVITGIPNFYRKFGYEMTVNLGGGRTGYKTHVPKLKKGKEEPYLIREATRDHLPFIAEVAAYGAKRSLLACLRDEALWQLELEGRTPKGIDKRLLRIIENKDGEPVGFLVHPDTLFNDALVCTSYELKAGISWLAVTPSVIRYLWKTGQAIAKEDQQEEKFAAFGFGLGEEHPSYKAAFSRLPRERKPYAWYIRVPDIPRFLSHIKPVLEERLATSIAVGHSGTLTISFYHSGIRFVFEQGKINTIEEWQPTIEKQGNAAFPYDTFLHLVFGHRSLKELRHIFVDSVVRNDEARVLLNALFPKQTSNIWPVA